MSDSQLTEGAISRFITAFNSGKEDTLAGWTPTVQVLTCKKVATKAGDPSSGRNRLIISDGTHFAQSMLASQHNDLIDNGTIQKLSVVRLKRFHANLLQGKRLIIILDLELVSHAPEKIGDPKSIESSLEQASAEPSPAPAPAPVQRTAPAPTPAPAPSASRPAPVKSSNTGPPPPIYPIDSLSPYQGKWTIKARVLQRSDIITWSNPRGEGKLFNVTLMDETGEIRATGFNQVVDELYDKLQEGKVYYISKARVNIAKKKFNSTGSDFEISFDKNTEVEECTDLTDVPEVKFKFIELSQLESMPADTICDVFGVVNQIGELQEINSKLGKKLSKKDLTIVDKSQYSVRLTLWGKQAESFSVEDQPVIAFKNVKVGDFGGKSLSAISNTTIHTNPDIQEAHLLRGWYDSEGHSLAFQKQSGGGGGGSVAFNRQQLKTLEEVKNSDIGTKETADFFFCRGTIIRLKDESMMYPACPGKKKGDETKDCNKKLSQNMGEGWHCESCGQSYDAPEWRYLLSVSVADHTNQLWLQAFNEVGVKMMGISANELNRLQEENSNAQADAVAKACGTTWNLSCRAKQDTYNDQTRIRYGISTATPLDYAAEARALVEVIQKYQ